MTIQPQGSTTAQENLAASTENVAPHPGSKLMPRWDVGELAEPPRFRLRNWTALLGPGIVAGGAAIGGGEWLTGPLVTARYGGGLLWFATLSILGQVLYNIEISRYTLYCGEPIFTGKFRTLPGPLFWMMVYLVLDFGSVFPYLATTASTPVAMVILGQVPDVDNNPNHWWLVRGLSYVIFILAIVPLIFGGKVYTSLKAVMVGKISIVLGFLLFLAIGYSTFDTWVEIGTGFFKFGNLPVLASEDTNGNGRLDSGEDWDGDGRLDGIEQRSDLNGNGDSFEPGEYIDEDGDGTYDGFKVKNVFTEVWRGNGVPKVDLKFFAILAAMAALAGTGGLTNTSVSGYTRDQGWGMGKHVGAIPSAVGGRAIRLSHVGMVFPVTTESRGRFRGWHRHVMRDQLAVWMPACFIGLALPSMLSVQFLARGSEASTWLSAGMTADGVASAVGGNLGAFCWYMTLFCGFLVLALSGTTTADGYFRRWVDVVWTGLPALRKWDHTRVSELYFGFLCVYVVGGLLMLTFLKPDNVLPWATNIYNYALGFSCFHVLAVNLIMLPRELRPSWPIRIGLVMAGVFFTLIAAITTLSLLGLA